MVLGVRQPGLAQVYDEILGFDGDEFYIEEWEPALGVCFGDLSEHFPDAIPLGIRNENGVIIKPNMMRPMEPGDEILVLAEDDDTYAWDQYLESDDPEGYDPVVEVSPGPGAVDAAKGPERILMVGWRRDVKDILELIDQLVAPGSEIHMVATKDIDAREEEMVDGGLEVERLLNLEIVHHVGFARRHFIKPHLRLHCFDSCIIVADEESEDDVMNSDSSCIQTLLMVRDVQMQMQDLAEHKHNQEEQLRVQQSCPILVETLDARTQDCIAASAALQSIADFVQSNEMVSRVLAMVSEERAVNIILEELLGGTGAGIELLPSGRYLHREDEELSFMQLCKRCQEVDHILMGYQIKVGKESETYMNPRDKLQVKGWRNVLLVVLTGQPYRPHLHDGKATCCQDSPYDFEV
eukprot:TRINITY_DN4051_c0_g1_i4.p2 TRINITY_DN4051_c0_g1~~TRINITY_DN4051_c0_g1_i4.p2  ORF type:complete len:409 (+),score=130.31 TRINITY_DN4051_c0_g1_i4:196-1422(+)